MMRYLFVGAFLCCLIGAPVFAQTDLISSNLPIVVIDTHGTFISDEPKITADMGIIDNGPGQRNNLSDPFNNYNGKIGIELRGSSSQSFPKKPYAVELQDDGGNGISASILGMPAEEDWTFIATYNDKSLIRDALAYKLARDLGRYAPRTRFVELVMKTYTSVGSETIVTNDYQGIYMVAEKIKRDNNRVDISKLEPSEISGDDLTGGYIIKIDKTSGDSGPGFNSTHVPPGRSGGQYINFQYEYPKYDEIVSQQKQYIQNYIDKFEDVLNSSTYSDEVNGYAKYIDVESFIDYLIINEVSKNVDGYRLSTFMYKDKESDGGKLTMGPVWDFNLAFGNADYCSGAPTSGWMYNFNSVCNDDSWLIPFWWHRLLQDPGFCQKLGIRWEEFRADELSTTKVFNYIDSISDVLSSEATGRNFEKWPVLGQWVWPNAYVGDTYESEISWLKGWITDRVLWLDRNMPSAITANEEEITEDIFSIRTYPNPFADHLKVDYSIIKPGAVKIELLDMLGRQRSVFERTHASPGNYEAMIGEADLANGMYIIKITSTLTKKTTVRAVIKVK